MILVFYGQGFDQGFNSKLIGTKISEFGLETNILKVEYVRGSFEAIGENEARPAAYTILAIWNQRIDP